MHQILNTLAVALSVLPHLPSVAIATEPAPVPTRCMHGHAAAACLIPRFSPRPNPEALDGHACQLRSGPEQAATVFDGANYITLTAN
jgi:hypothetical protein